MKKAGEFYVPDAEVVQLDALGAGGWQLDHLNYALKRVTKFDVAIDGGAHVGSWTREMAKRFRSVIAYEPNFETFDCLKKNLEGLSNVRCFNRALGAKWERAEMGEDGKYSNGGNTGGRFILPTLGGAICVMPLDDCKIGGSIDFIKLDLEGYELFALRGGRETIVRHKPVIMIEVKHRMSARYELRPDDAGRFLSVLGMRELGHIGSDFLWGWP